MLRALTLTICLLLSLPVDAAVYRYIDENGNVAFSDKPREGAETVPLKLPPSVTLKQPTPTASTSAEPTPAASPIIKERAKPYRTFKILKPAKDETIWHNDGKVTVNLSIIPALQTQFGHRVQLALDGKRISQQWQTSQMTIDNVERGTHQLKAYLIDEQGKRLKTSPSTTFYLKKASVLLNRAP